MELTQQPKSLYDASNKDIFSKNFLAGFAHGMGGLVITIITWVIIYLIFTRLVLPQLNGLLEQSQSLLQTVERISSPRLLNPINNAPQSSQDTPSVDTSTQIQIPPALLQQLLQQQPVQ